MHVPKLSWFWRSSRIADTAAMALRVELGYIADCHPARVHLVNFSQYQAGHRYLYFTTDTAFGKLARDERNKAGLRREGSATQLAQQLGLQAARVIQPYFEVSNDQAGILLEKLPAQRMLREYQDLARLPYPRLRRYARLCVISITKASFRPLSVANASDFLLRQGDEVWAVANPDRLLKEIGHLSAMFERRAMQSALLELFGEEVASNLIHQLRRLPGLVRRIAARWPAGETEYFVHNDVTIKNVCFARSRFKDTPFLVDFELAAATRHPVLGLLRDLTLCYGVSAYNPDFQRELIEAFVHSSVGSEEDREVLATTAILLGTLYIGHYPLLRAKIATKSSGTPLTYALASDDEWLIFSNLTTYLSYNLSAATTDESLYLDFNLSSTSDRAEATGSL
jgi:hypothetical protein